MPDIARFEDSTGLGRPVELEVFEVPADLDDHAQRVGRIPETDPYYVDLGMLYQLALIEEVRRVWRASCYMRGCYDERRKADHQCVLAQL